MFNNKTCVACNQVLDINMQSYNVDHVGLELTLILEEMLNHEVDCDGSLCSNCFNRATHSLSQRPVFSSANHCVWCLHSIIGRHTHSLPDCPEKEYIALCILPRQIQQHNRVCYACWLAARRNVQRQDCQGTSSAMQQIESQHIDMIESHPSTSTKISICVWCQRSIVGQHSHLLPQCAERDEIASHILPRQIEPNSRACYACWLAARRNVRREALPQNSHNASSVRLPNYKRVGNSSNTCFVRGCTNPERYNVPKFLKQNLLKMYKLYIPKSGRICKEHLSVYDWGFLEKQKYGQSFSVLEIEDVINLALEKEDNNFLDFENIERMSDQLCHYWTGVNIQHFLRIIEQTPLLRDSIKTSKNALAILLVKLRTGEPNSRLAELFGMSESNISNLLRKVRDAFK